MKRDWLIWLAIGAALIAATGTGIYMLARGIRNKNPGNIRHGSSQWQGMAPVQTDTDFVQFTSPVYGIRALAKLLKNYQARYGLDTVEEIISRYAPPNENITGSYVRAVADSIGVDPREPINVAEKLPELIQAIIRHENNGKQPYSQTIINDGIALA